MLVTSPLAASLLALALLALLLPVLLARLKGQAGAEPMPDVTPRSAPR